MRWLLMRLSEKVKEDQEKGPAVKVDLAVKVAPAAVAAEAVKVVVVVAREVAAEAEVEVKAEVKAVVEEAEAATERAWKGAGGEWKSRKRGPPQGTVGRMFVDFARQKEKRRRQQAQGAGGRASQFWVRGGSYRASGGG